jgi:hypothetical protein
MPTDVTMTDDQKRQTGGLVATLVRLVHEADATQKANLSRRITDGSFTLTLVAGQLTQITFTQSAFGPF